MIYPKSFREKSPQVRAILLEQDNVAVVMRWIGQHSATPIYKRMNDTFIIDLIDGEIVIELGWWVVRDQDGAFSTCTPEYMEEHYEGIEQ